MDTRILLYSCDLPFTAVQLYKIIITPLCSVVNPCYQLDI
nr:MAG TPA: hypothetical protein [Caudoviricetes sp.]